MNISMNGSFTKHKITGIQRYSYEMAKRIPFSKIYCPTDIPDDYKDMKSLSNIELINSELSSALWENTLLALKTKEDILFNPGGFGIFTHKNQVLTIHDVAPIDGPNWYSKQYALIFKSIVPITTRVSRKIITVSNYSADRIVKLFNIHPNKIEVTHLGVDSRFKAHPVVSKQEIYKKYDIEEGYLLCVSAISSRKNFERIVQAWNSIDKSGLKLLIVGQVNAKFADSNFTAKNTNSVTYTGHITDDELASLYTHCVAFVYPSLYEGFGLPIVEAMAAGAPVITSNVTSMPEIAGKAAITVDPYSIDEIRSAMKALIHNKDLRNDLIEKGKLRSDKFRWEKTADQTLSILQTNMKELK